MPSRLFNRELPAWLRLSGEERVRVEGWNGIGFRNADDLFALNRLRLNLLVTPLPWLKFSFQAQDARVAGNNIKPAPSSQKDAVDLRQGYMELGDSESSSMGLRVGRQALTFGDGRLVADSGWSNVGRTFDAVRVTWRYGGLRVDGFASSVVVCRDGEFNRPLAGDNLHGLYGSAQRLVPGATVDLYTLWRLSPKVAAESGLAGKLDSHTTGVRWAGKLRWGFDYAAEVAGQTGRFGNDRIGAWASHWVVGHTLPIPQYQPRLFAEYDYASGDADPKDGRHASFDQLYPSSHDKFGIADQFMWSNLRHVRLGGEAKARKWLTMGSSYHHFGLVSARDALFAPGAKVVARVPSGSAGRDVGSEWDLQALSRLSKSTQVGWGYSHIFTGQFLRRALPGVSQNSVYFSVARLL